MFVGTQEHTYGCMPCTVTCSNLLDY